MADIPTLRTDERELLLGACLGSDHLDSGEFVSVREVMEKALGIIDAQAKRIAEIKRKLDEVWDRWEMAQVDPACRDLALDQIGDLLRDPTAPLPEPITEEELQAAWDECGFIDPSPRAAFNTGYGKGAERERFKVE